MGEITRKTTTTRASQPEEPNASTMQTAEYIIYFLFGALEILLAFRFVLKLTGAGPSSDFVNFIYNFSSIFVVPFEGIFRTGTTQGVETTAVFEPATIVAILVFAVLAWGLAQLLRVLSGKKQPE